MSALGVGLLCVGRGRGPGGRGRVYAVPGQIPTMVLTIAVPIGAGCASSRLADRGG